MNNVIASTKVVYPFNPKRTKREFWRQYITY